MGDISIKAMSSSEKWRLGPVLILNQKTENNDVQFYSIIFMNHKEET